jgi:hypothetical protein
MFIIFWNSETEPTIALRDDCTCFLSGKQVIVCSESFKDIKTSQSAAKPDVSQGGLPAWGRGLEK